MATNASHFQEIAKMLTNYAKSEDEAQSEKFEIMQLVINRLSCHVMLSVAGLKKFTIQSADALCELSIFVQEKLIESYCEVLKQEKSK